MRARMMKRMMMIRKMTMLRFILAGGVEEPVVYCVCRHELASCKCGKYVLRKATSQKRSFQEAVSVLI